MPDAVRSEIRALSTPTDNEIERLGRLDVTLGQLIGKSVNALLSESGVANSEVIAIGSHGQTLRHRPDANPPFTLQAGDPNTITARTGITTVADFRRMDMALGGHGAPLAPIFHAAVFREFGTDIAVLNLGGIANLSILPGNPSEKVLGFDTGPGNCLMDEWSQESLSVDFDRNGEWASKGKPDVELLETLLMDKYFNQPTPKSTGREKFNLNWIRAHNDLNAYTPENLQATLAELTIRTILDALALVMPKCQKILVCGGGVENGYLMQRLSMHIKSAKVLATEHAGIHQDWIEAIMFAFLASCRMKHQDVNIMDITGSNRNHLCGTPYEC
jgi:anhydro-N-acetylmuramic acid kinase